MTSKILSRLTRIWKGAMFLLGIGFLFSSSPGLTASEMGGKPEKNEIIVSYPQPSGAFAPLWVAFETGLFNKYGLMAQLQLLNPQVSVQALISGSADFTAAGVDLLSARLRGARVKLIAVTLEKLVFQMWGIKEITDIQNLKGKTVALSSPRSVIEIATREVLKKSGLTPEKDTKFIFAKTVDAILNLVLGGQAVAGTLSAPTTLKARDSGLNLVADFGKLNIPGIHAAFGATEKYLNDNPNTAHAFLKAIAEGMVITKNDPATTKRAIAKYTKMDDPRMVDEAYEAFAPHWANSLAARSEVVQAWFGYLDEKEFPQAKNANAKEFYDNSFIDGLEKAGFFQKIGRAK